MPVRKISFVNGGIYHIFNKTIESKKIFIDDYINTIFCEITRYYRSFKTYTRFSQFKELSSQVQNQVLKDVLNPVYFQVEILCYCLMPTHFHFLVKQLTKNGVQKYMANVLNSFTRYFNIKNERKGPLFLPRFKAVNIKSEEQLKHNSRYIHLNPYSNGLIEDINELEKYPWSSFKEYVFDNPQRLSSPNLILNLFNNDRNRYKKFVFDNADYQKTLDLIKHVKDW